MPSLQQTILPPSMKSTLTRYLKGFLTNLQKASKEFANAEAIRTIEDHPQLFAIMTPIKINVLEKYLETHPNPEFIQSIMTGLCEGFWPWADTQHDEGFPITWDNVRMNPRFEMEQQFIVRYRDEEATAGHFSQPFGLNLLPGMYSTPMHAVPKPHSEDFCMVSNILHTLFVAILCFQQESPASAEKTLVVFKSDVSKAYRLCLMHPVWQLKQVVTTRYLTSKQKAAEEEEILVRSIDRNNNFRGQGSGHIWYSVNGLITWITINIENISDLGGMTLIFYKPYDSFYPCKQMKLLRLWDHLGVPHSKPKQLYGLQLIIIGFNVDPNAMTATMPEDSKTDLVLALWHFASSNQRNLQEYQQIAGWSNWSFKVFPLLKPGLCNVYAKMQGKMNPFAGIALNNAIKDDLSWLADHIKKSNRICCFDTLDWDPIVDAMVTILCDACLNGMGFWLPKISCGFVCPMPELPDVDKIIFFFEALCVCTAIHSVAANLSPAMRKRVTIFTDNTNTVNVFNSLRASPTYNPILKSTVNILISHAIELRVLHIPGSENDVADALSCSQFSRARSLVPQLLVLPFKPPHDWCLALGSTIDMASLGPYNSALNSYITFCKIHNFPVKPTADTMSYYTIFMSSHIKPESVSSYLSGICNDLESFFPNVCEIRNSPMVSCMLKGCKWLKGSEVKCKAPLSRDNIRHAISKLGHSSDYDDFTGFNGLLRLAELSMPDSKKSQNWRKIVRRTTIEWIPEGHTFFLPAHKADTAFKGNKVIIPSNNNITFDPLPIFRRYLTLRDTKHIVHPALIAGQSMHAGGAKDLAEQGVLPYLIQAHGRWSSSAFKIYIQKNPVILQAMIDTRAPSI
ncbi:hypothetical protein ARMGADRAFT_1047939 [Armillaria gallica]|uniref:Uncharacterized protein n=1 Tax=Armillaria gallica TaxID=47427 RepID=A0A2H3CX58_ARMGA|nr:hypothetical protein ARMGADRAFT_1047939 [Armillaria gallica]